MKRVCPSGGDAHRAPCGRAGAAGGRTPRAVPIRLLSLVLALLTLSGCSGQGHAPEASPSPAGPVEVTVATVRLQDLPRRISTVGTTRSVNEASISPRSAGLVLDVPVSLGDRVRKGDVLIQQDTQELRMQLGQDEAQLLVDLAQLGLDRPGQARPESDAPAVQRARANLDNARLNWNRSQNLYRANLIAEAELQQNKQALLTAQADYNSALDQVRTSRANVGVREAALRTGRLRLEQMTTRAPFDGFITAVNINEGDFVSPGGGGQDPYLRLTQLDPIEVRLELAQAYAAELKVGQTMEVSADAFPGRTFTGRVVHVNPSADPQTRAIAVDARFANPRGLLRPGLFGSVELRIGTRKNAPLVPRTALQKTIGGFQVFVVDGGVARPVAVTPGDPVGEWIAVDGLKGGQKVATSSLDRLYDGSPVQVK